jgi:hypothetical protein
MTKNSHTPGPWVVEPRQWDHGASLAIVAPANGFIVAIVPFDEDIQTEDSPTADTVRRHPDEIPNANILAAAPALFKALETWAFADADPAAARFKGYYDRARERRDQLLRQLGSKAVRS